MPTDMYQLSPIQQGMLFHWLLDRHSGTDIEQIIADLREPIDPSRLERAWNSVLEAYSTLRTAFDWSGQVPLQGIAPSSGFRIAVEDLRELPAEKRQERLQEYLAWDRQEGFDLSKSPLMRVALFSLGEAHYRMVWSFHHILIDGRAFEVILNALFAAYETDQSLGVTDRPYREYIEWVIQQDLSASRQFWQNKLKGFTAPTPILHDRVERTDVSRFGQLKRYLSQPATDALRKLAERGGFSLNTVVMGAWALLQSHYSGESDIVFGATKTTRRGTIPDADSIVGLFLATIPMRVTVNDEISVLEWLQHVRAEWTSLRGYEHLPLVDIKSVSELPSSASLFDTLVVFENYQFGTRLSSQGGAWKNRQFDLLEQTNFPLTLAAYGDDALALKIDFDARRFQAATIERMLGHLSAILTSWATSSDVPVSRTSILTEEERRATLVGFNATERAYPRDTPLAALVEEQVERTPGAVAVTYGDQTITYRELNSRANQLARDLQARGAGPNVLVGVCVERSINMMIALLAVIKAGAAYVPLDPQFPADRIRFMLEDSGLQVLIAETSTQVSVADGGVSVTYIDSEEWQKNSNDNLKVDVPSEAPAYVIYTSGSTGRPKGVQLSRASLINLLWSMREWLALAANDRLLAVTTISFDIAGVDIWLPWLVGAETVLASREAAADGPQLSAMLRDHDITFLQATPVTWKLLLAAGWQGKKNLTAVCTGEAMPPDLAASLVGKVQRLWNLYGPTETTIWSTGYKVDKIGGSVLIGKPVANTRCYILDPRREPVAVGASGELYIAGDGLAMGYLNRPDLTADKFVADPFHPGELMYRTGDLARYYDDGNIECLGRTDHQVKIRGFRIELGEIESLLKAHPDVSEAVVIAREDVPGDKRLVGYVVPTGKPLDVMEARGFLRERLPDYMIPAAFVNLPAMPLTANGKIDRRALPEPDMSTVVQSRSIVAPSTHAEKQLAEIWEEIFALPRVSVDDDFFDLGGHSLLALQLMAKIKQVFGEQLPLNTLFESPTIARLATHIGHGESKEGNHTLVSIQASGSRPPIYWIPGGAALGMFSLRHVVTRLGPDQPVYGLGSSHPKSLDHVESVEERAANYLKLVRKNQPTGPYCFAGFCAGGRVAFEMAQQLVKEGEDVAFVGMINCWFPKYPSGKPRKLLCKIQRLLYQVRAARAEGVSLPKYIKSKLDARRSAEAERAKLDAAKAQVTAHGFQHTESAQNQLLLNRTVEVFDRYEPRPYPGPISLFISDDDELRGVTRPLDPRFAWTKYASQHEVRTFPGGHQAVLEMPYAVDFAATLKAALDKALEKVSP